MLCVCCLSLTTVTNASRVQAPIVWNQHSNSLCFLQSWVLNGGARSSSEALACQRVRAAFLTWQVSSRLGWLLKAAFRHESVKSLYGLPNLLMRLFSKKVSFFFLSHLYTVWRTSFLQRAFLFTPPPPIVHTHNIGCLSRNAAINHLFLPHYRRRRSQMHQFDAILSELFYDTTKPTAC